MPLNACQEVTSYLLNELGGQMAASRKQFEKKFRDAPYGEPDSLMLICIKWFFKNGDFTDLYGNVAEMVKGKNLALFSNCHMSCNQGLMRVIIENAVNKSKKVRIVIKKDEFAIVAGRGRLVTYQFTEDMEETATIFAEYVEMLFKKPSYDIEFTFEGSYGIYRNMDLNKNHILLLKNLKPKHFAEKGHIRRKRERIGRLSLCMCRIRYSESGIYYNAIIQFFDSLRATVWFQGEQPESKVHMTYAEALSHTLKYPDIPLIDKACQAKLQTSFFKRKRESFNIELGFFTLRNP